MLTAGSRRADSDRRAARSFSPSREVHGGCGRERPDPRMSTMERQYPMSPLDAARQFPSVFDINPDTSPEPEAPAEEHRVSFAALGLPRPLVTTLSKAGITEPFQI